MCPASQVRTLRSCYCKKSKITGGIDSAMFQEGLVYIYKLILTDSQIAELEKEAATFNKGSDEDLSYFIKFAIFDRLCNVNFNEAFEYGNLNYKRLESSKTPSASLFKYNFPHRPQDSLSQRKNASGGLHIF